jgi:hypothetical protein
MERIGIEGVKTTKREGRRIVVNFVEKGTDEVLFALNKNLQDDLYVDVINCQLENVNGVSKITIPLIASATVKRDES